MGAMGEQMHGCSPRITNEPAARTLRERFLREAPENARPLELARQRWGDLQP